MFFEIRHYPSFFLKMQLTKTSDIIIEDNITAEEKFFGNLTEDNLFDGDHESISDLFLIVIFSVLNWLYL